MAGLIIVLTGYISSAQSKNVIRKVQAFYVVRMPGNIPSVPSLIRIDTVLTIYLETTSKVITWDTAFKKNHAFLIRAAIIEKTAFEAGRVKKTGEKIIIKPQKGLFLWQLWLEPIEPGLPIPGIQKVMGDAILLQGKYKGKKLVLTVDKAVELAAIPAV